MKKRILLLILFLMGFGILLYPVVTQIVSNFNQSYAILNYQQTISQLDDEVKQSLKEEANHYNHQLLEQATVIEGKSYLSLLDVGEAMGYIQIPKIKVDLPIYHGTSEAALQKGVGHMENTSLPVGGLGTHAVLTGHTGLPQATLFTNLTKLELGDTFSIHLLDEVLYYEVDQIKVVLPEETSDLQIIEGEDYVTLITCTPYGVNSHRLLVRGTRVEEVESEEEETSSATESQSSSKKEVVDLQNQLLMNSKIYLVLGIITLIGSILFIVKIRKRG